MLKGDVFGTVFNQEDLQVNGNILEDPKPPEDNIQNNSTSVEPAHPSDGNLCLIAPLGSSDMGTGDNVDDMWMGSPCQVEKDAWDPLQNA